MIVKHQTISHEVYLYKDGGKFTVEICLIKPDNQSYETPVGEFYFDNVSDANNLYNDIITGSTEKWQNFFCR